MTYGGSSAECAQFCIAIFGCIVVVFLEKPYQNSPKETPCHLCNYVGND